jgi:hypothetical protein
VKLPIVWFGMGLDLLHLSFNYQFLKPLIMLYLIAVILIVGWLLGFFVFNATGLIHILLVIAVIAILLRLIQGRNPV